MVFASLAFLVAVAFLPVLELSRSYTYWDVSTAPPIVLLVVATIGLCMALISLVRGGTLTPVLATVCAAYLFGKVFSISDYGSGLGTGYWTMVSASLLMVVGGVLASVDRSSSSAG
jgi:hypothetical protein